MCDLNLPKSAPSTSRISVDMSLSGEHEVFLSFCGKDTRNGFTDFLYTYLQGAGVRTFRDDNELRVGEEIGPELTKAIENSKICIPIFSKNYASSKWCLLELAHVVKCHTEANREKMIFPIFYDVEPHDVRHQSGSCEEAFRQHEKKKRLEVQTVQIWKEALAKVGRLKELELKKETGGYIKGLDKQQLQMKPALQTCLNDILQLLLRFHKVWISFVYREANAVADLLSKFSFSASGFWLFNQEPGFVHTQMVADRMGCFLLRKADYNLPKTYCLR